MADKIEYQSDYLFNLEVMNKFNQLIDQVNSIADPETITGWIQVLDTTNTDLVPQTILADNRVKLDINSDSVLEDHAPSGTTASDYYDPVTKKVKTLEEGSAFIFRLNMTIKPALTNGAIDLDFVTSNGSEIVILERATTLSKGTDEFLYTTSNLYYTDSNFLANGGEFFLKPTVNVDIYDISLLISRIH